MTRKGWIVNSTSEPVQFYVYNSYDVLRWIPAHRVYAQPGETVQVQGGYFQRDNDDMVVYKDNEGLAYNIKRNHLHFWTDSTAKGSRMIMYKSSMECFKKTQWLLTPIDSANKSHHELLTPPDHVNLFTRVNGQCRLR